MRPYATKNSFKWPADKALDDTLRAVFASRCFASCARRRASLAACTVVCWTSYCFFVWRLVSEDEHPRVLADVTFCFLASAPMVLCVYFMCGFHRFGSQQGFDYSAQHTVGGQRLGINVSAHQYSEREATQALDMLYGTVTEADVSDCVPLLLSDAESEEEHSECA